MVYISPTHPEGTCAMTPWAAQSCRWMESSKQNTPSYTRTHAHTHTHTHTPAKELKYQIGCSQRAVIMMHNKQEQDSMLL